jgi:hypothetical protein
VYTRVGRRSRVGPLLRYCELNETSLSYILIELCRQEEVLDGVDEGLGVAVVSGLMMRLVNAMSVERKR